MVWLVVSHSTEETIQTIYRDLQLQSEHGLEFPDNVKAETSFQVEIHRLSDIVTTSGQ